jgi:hypothetical protein
VVPAARRDAVGIGGIASNQHNQNDEGPVVDDRPFSFLLREREVVRANLVILTRAAGLSSDKASSASLICHPDEASNASGRRWHGSAMFAALRM